MEATACSKGTEDGSSARKIAEATAIVGAGVLGVSVIIEPLVPLGIYIGAPIALVGLLMLRCPLHRCPVLVPALLFALWLIVAEVLRDFDGPFRRSRIPLGLSLVILGWAFSHFPRMFRSVLFGVLIGAILSGSLGLAQFLIGFEFENPPLRIEPGGIQFQYAVGLSSHHIVFGTVIFAAGLFLHGAVSDRRLGRPAIAGSVIGFISLVISGSRGVFLGALPALWIYAVAGRKGRTIIIASLVALVIIFSAFVALRAIHPERVDRMLTGDDVRLRYWTGASMMIREYPWFGVGSRNYPEAYELGVREKNYPAATPYDHAHNSILNLAATSGLPAVGFFLVLMLVLGIRFWQRRKQSLIAWRLGSTMLVFYLVTGMTNDHLTLPGPAYPFFLFFGVILGWPSAEPSEQAGASDQASPVARKTYPC